MLEAARVFSELGDEVTLYTTRLDPEESFAEARSGAFRLVVQPPVVPLTIGGALRLPLALARMRRLARKVVEDGPHELVFLDGHPIGAPVLRRGNARLAYYCHHPEQVRSEGAGLLRRAYRAPLDALERRAIAAPHVLFANSEFTREAMRRAYPQLETPVEVLYPPVPSPPAAAAPTEPHTLLALHRFDPTKNVGLALEALALVRKSVPDARLVVAGGVSRELRSSAEELARLRRLAVSLDLLPHVEFVPNPGDAAVGELLARCGVVVFTPAAEHFGIVPVEAMARGRPVVASNTGGPVETVVEGVTGLLVPPTAADFAAAITSLLLDPARQARLGAAGPSRAADFGRAAFRARLAALLD